MRDAFLPPVWAAFELAWRPWMAGRVGPVLAAGLPRGLPPDRPLLLCPNHGSWWDGFLIRSLQRRLRPGAPLRTVMLESELRRRPLLRLLGGTGLVPGSVASLRRLVRTLERGRENRPDLVVALFPQGRIGSPTLRPLGFRPGMRLVARALAPATILPVAVRLAFGTEPRAAAFLSVGEPLDGAEWTGDPRVVEARVEEELDALALFLERHGEEAVAAWPSLHGRLPRREAGAAKRASPLSPYTGQRSWLCPN